MSSSRPFDNVLVTGGAGFIGSHVVDLLVERGYSVSVLDILDAQVHGSASNLPDHFNEKAEMINGDIRDKNLIIESLRNVDAVIHLAAAVGVGQSMYQIDHYTDVNTLGTAKLLDVLVNEVKNIKKLVVASSMSIYGEGAYKCEKCGSVHPDVRVEEQLMTKDWAPRCPICQGPIQPMPTNEDHSIIPTSVYAQTKRHQEEMCLLIGRTYKIPTVALRFFSVYGPRQSLNNPYTGVCSLFSARILSDKPPLIFEDGHQVRDFVNVRDLAKANILALERSDADYMAVNVGGGKPVSILDLANEMLKLHGSDLAPQVTQQYRAGDIRHCYADIGRARKLLGYDPAVTLEQGLKELYDWTSKKSGIVDSSDKAMAELRSHNLLTG
ncbi:MAG: SDR family NAD(P)-dependent oxidoreductase [Thaumarchaeota archaeon]|nr:SDR family NAD(P)-dependent oxidoreductase [Nitrososphaerota archaeon]